MVIAPVDAVSLAALRLAARELTTDAPTTDDELLDWLADVTGHRIPSRAVCADHQAPSAFVVDLFFERVSEALVLANRAGGKTENTAALHVANAYHKPGFETSHIGAIDQQAKRGYAYYQKAIRSPIVAPLVPDSHIRETVWTNRSKIEILPGTEAQTQGGHPALCCFDELEQGKYQPYENAKSMPVPYRPGDITSLGQFVATSTRQSSLGLMQRALDDAEREGTPVYVWCVLETMQKCDGQDGRPECNGEECPLWQWCEGRVQYADGWRSKNEILAMFRRVGADTWESQHMCQKPDTKALIYAPFSKANITTDAEYIDGAGPLFVSYDWGFTDPTHIGLYQYRDGHMYMFNELTGSGRSERTWVREMIRLLCDLPGYTGPSYIEWEEIWSTEQWPEQWPEVWPEIVAGDPSAVQMRAELKAHGLPSALPKRVKHRVTEGQDVLRAAILSAGDDRRVFVHPRNVHTIKAYNTYRAKELADGSFAPEPDPDPANHAYSHPCDSARYLFWRIRRMLGINAGSGEDDE